MTETLYPRLFSEWTLRRTSIPNRIVFAPTCPTWVANPVDGVFTEQAVAYYEERAKAGCGLIIIGGTIVRSGRAVWRASTSPASGTTRRSRGSRGCVRRCTGTGAGSPIQLLHPGLAHARGDPEGSGLRSRCALVHRRTEPGSARRVAERADAEGARGARDPGDHRVVRGRRPAAPPMPVSTGSSTTSPTATCRGSSCRRSTTTARTAGAGPSCNRLRFSVESLRAMREAGGDAAVHRLPHQLDVLLAGRPRDGRRQGGHRASSTARWTSTT